MREEGREKKIRGEKVFMTVKITRAKAEEYYCCCFGTFGIKLSIYKMLYLFIYLFPSHFESLSLFLPSSLSLSFFKYIFHPFFIPPSSFLSPAHVQVPAKQAQTQASSPRVEIPHSNGSEATPQK
jgi:hypothetical protein